MTGGLGWSKFGRGPCLVKGTLFDSLYPKLATIVGPVVLFYLVWLGGATGF